MNLKRVHRLHPLEGLRMRRKPMRRLAMAQRRCERPNPLGPNQVWVMVWIHEELFAGRRIWALTVVDVWSCLCPVPRACRQAKAAEVVEALWSRPWRATAPQG